MSESHDGNKVKYITVGTIKTIDLSNHTFTIEPIAAYRFQTKVDDDKSWKIIFKEEKGDPKELKLVASDAKFKFTSALSSAIIILKQGKTRVRMTLGGRVDEATKTVVPDLERKVEMGII